MTRSVPIMIIKVYICSAYHAVAFLIIRNNLTASMSRGDALTKFKCFDDGCDMMMRDRRCVKLECLL